VINDLPYSNSEALTISQDPQGETVLFTLTARGQYFTSLEKTAALRPASFTCLCTSQEVIWMDETRPGDSVLSWRHDYGGGRVDDLEVAVVETGHGGMP